jgi:polyisoprenoid-binding protein YceI
MRRIGFGVALLALVLPTGLAPADTPWLVPADSRIEFVGTNLFSTAEGVFHRWRIVDASVQPARPSESSVTVEVQVASLDTGIERRDDHLRTDDFFDAARFPTARVRVHDVRATNENFYRARFDIRIRDVEKSLDGEFELVRASPPTVAGQLTLKRTDFGVGSAPSRWNPMSVDDEVLVRFNAVLEAGP